jgi:quinol monooxygenase YgiN
MVRLTVALASSPRGIDDLLVALQFIRTGARFEEGCLACDAWADADAVVHYMEEWATEADMRRRVQSDRFTSLLAVMESSKDPPEVKFDFVTTTRGLDYVAEIRGRVEDTAAANLPPANGVTGPGEPT